jgi:hypothetical protein
VLDSCRKRGGKTLGLLLLQQQPGLLLLLLVGVAAAVVGACRGVLLC